MTDRALLQQALDALMLADESLTWAFTAEQYRPIKNAIPALRARLTELAKAADEITRLRMELEALKQIIRTDRTLAGLVLKEEK